MPSKTLHLCLVLLAICINHETLSQAIVDFKCTVEFPICQKPGVAREEQDIVSFSIVLDMENTALDRWMWQLVAVVFDDGDVLENYRRKRWLAFMYTTACTGAGPLSIEYRYRNPYQKCRQDIKNKRLLRMEIGVPASTRYNMSSLVAVWISRADSYKISNSVRYPMVLLRVEEKLRVDYEDMPGHNAYIRPGHNHVFQYCVTVKHTSWSLINFKIGDRPNYSYSRSNGKDNGWCPSYPVTTTEDDLHQTLRLSYWEIYGPCLMHINSTGLILDARPRLTTMNGSDRPVVTRFGQLVLILVTLSGTVMWLSSTLDYLG